MDLTLQQTTRPDRTIADSDPARARDSRTSWPRGGPLRNRRIGVFPLLDLAVADPLLFAAPLLELICPVALPQLSYVPRILSISMDDTHVVAQVKADGLR